MIRTTIAAAALASAGMGLVMLAPDAPDTTLAESTDFITVDDDTQLDDALEEAGLLDDGPGIEPVAFEVPATEPPAAALEIDETTTTDDVDGDVDEDDGQADGRDGRRRGDRDGRADR